MSRSSQQHETQKQPVNMNRDPTPNPAVGSASPQLPTLAEIHQRTAELLALSALQEEREQPPLPDPEPPPPQPPFKLELEEDAFYGPAGSIVRILAPHSESHPAAILLQLLAAFSNAVGPGPHCMVESTRHALNLFVVLVGDSSKARKGTSWSLIANLFADVDQSWLATRVNRARLTAIGLVQALRDQQPTTDRRLLLLAEEFSSVLQMCKRGAGHLSPLLRGAWDNGDLPTLDLRQHLRATGAHVSLIAHITCHELAQTFDRKDVHNGFANRCLWTWVERGNCLPEGGSPTAQERSDAAATLRRAVDWATARPQILFRRDQAASALWAQCYPELSYQTSGFRGAATSRGEAQVLRLSAIYAALDCSEIIGVPHLTAALTLWTYCYRSAARLFGASTGDTVADRIHEAMETSRNGLSRKQIRTLFHGHVDSERIDAALAHLSSLGVIIAHRMTTAGRPATLWSLNEPQ